MTGNLIGRVRRLLMSPAGEWDVIDGETADVPGLYRAYIVPLTLFSVVATFIGTYFYSRDFAGLRPLLERALVHAVFSLLIGLALVYVFALSVSALAPSFGARKNFGQAFKVAAYAPTAYWAGGIFMVIPGLRMVSALVALYSLYLLFVGLPKLMKPAPDRGPLYAVTAMLCLVGLEMLMGWLAGIRPFY